MITIEQLIDVVRDASSLMISDSFEIEQKGGCENIVTSSDMAVQNFLCDKLSTLVPASGFLCEEKEIHDVAHEYTWIIDPIDGTANYSRGIDQCAICVGLKQADEMRMGVVYLPRTNELFHAEKGKGAYLNGRRIHVSDRPFANAILCTALPVYHKEYADVCSRIIVETFHQCNDIRRFGACAPELCYLAMGRCELYFEYLLSPWDYAAASLIVTEAGGMSTSAQGDTLCLTRPSGVIAANSAYSHQRLLEIVARQTNHKQQKFTFAPQVISNKND